MLLVAIARPRFDVQGNEVFSRKIGVFPFVTLEPAKRTRKSPYRPLRKNGQERTYEIQFLFNRTMQGYTLIIMMIIIQEGLDIHLMCQHANSPDLNFFRSWVFQYYSILAT